MLHMQLNLLRHACALLTVASCSGIATYELAADEFDSIRDQIRTQLVERNTPSLAVAVARGGEIVWEEGFGWADREGRIPATEHTMYSQASISKPFTATGLMILVDQGRVDLDKPVNDYLGEAKLVARVGDVAEATVRRVANHTSGLPLHYQFFYVDEPAREPAFDETIRRYGNLVTLPGERTQYSNLGYGVLDYVIARTSGRSYPDFMREQVFLPLGLTRTSIHIGPGLKKHTATRYGGDGLPIPFYDFDHDGGSAVFSSAHDLVRFGMFHLGNRTPEQKEILPAARLEEMQKVTNETGPGEGYGVSWATGRHPKSGQRTVSHSGGMGGVRTLLTLVPDSELVVVALTNGENGLPMRISNEILNQLLPEAASDKSDQEKSAASENSDEDGEQATLDSLRGEWGGTVHTYNGDLPLQLTVQEDGDVHVKLGSELPTLLAFPRFRDGYLRGRFAGDLGTEDVNRRPYRLHFEVKLRDDRLNGSCTAMSVPSNRTGNALTHWVELERKK